MGEKNETIYRFLSWLLSPEFASPRVSVFLFLFLFSQTSVDRSRFGPARHRIRLSHICTYDDIQKPPSIQLGRILRSSSSWSNNCHHRPCDKAEKLQARG